MPLKMLIMWVYIFYKFILVSHYQYNCFVFPSPFKNHQLVVLLHLSNLKNNREVKILMLDPVSTSDLYDKSMCHNVKLVMSLKVKENSCKNEYFLASRVFIIS